MTEHVTTLPTFAQHTIVAWFLFDASTGKRERIPIENRHTGQPERTCHHRLKRGERCSTCVIEAMQLSCGHRQNADIPRPAGSMRKTAPCDRCGYSPRRQVERFLLARRQTTFSTDLQFTLRRALSEHNRTAALAEFVIVALDVVHSAPRSEIEEQRLEKLHRAASVAGLLDVRHNAE